MVTLGSLWLPILLGGLAVFFTSFVTRMVLKYHWSDFQKLPNEDEVMKTIGASVSGPGQYSMPHCADSKAMQDPEWLQKWANGPAGFLFLFPKGPYSFGKALGQSLAFNIFIAFMAAYLATMVLAPGADGSLVLRFIATVGFLGFGGAEIWGPIWKGSSWTVCLKDLFDALLYGLAMGAVFMALWPDAAVPA